jgi:hypothetical protein
MEVASVAGFLRLQLDVVYFQVKNKEFFLIKDTKDVSAAAYSNRTVALAALR